MWSRNAGRTSDTPKTDRASRHRPTPDRAAPCPLRSADSGCADRFRSCARILYDSLVIPAIVLAAGKSTRMGRPKATLPLDNGDTFLTRIVHTFVEAGVEDVVIVIGHDADAIVASFASADAVASRARFVDNPDYELGQLSSLAAGLKVVDKPGVAAVLM